MAANSYTVVESTSALPSPDASGCISQHVFKYVDFNEVPQYVFARHKFLDCCFMGCVIPPEMEEQLGSTCLVFPRLGRVYNVFRGKLYTAQTLYDGYDPLDDKTFATCLDSRIYQDYVQKGKQDCFDIRETLGRSLHDRAIEDAMNEFLRRYDEKQIVAVMGGHALKRTDEAYRTIVMISKTLTEKGKLMCSGGGPGAMEATHLGAWMAGRGLKDVDKAMEILEIAPTFRDDGWLRTAFEVRELFPQERFRSLGIPTWFYGHEPSTPFATDIAKFFMNSIREDTLLSIAKGGMIYTPGSAGTMQEVFQDAAQNHYETLGYASPMVFLGKEFFIKEIPVYPLLEDLIARGKYNKIPISITDEIDEAVQSILAFGKPEKSCYISGP